MGLTRNATDNPEGDRLFQAECLDCGWLGVWHDLREQAERDRLEHRCVRINEREQA